MGHFVGGGDGYDELQHQGVRGSPSTGRAGAVSERVRPASGLTPTPVILMNTFSHGSGRALRCAVVTRAQVSDGVPSSSYTPCGGREAAVPAPAEGPVAAGRGGELEPGVPGFGPRRLRAGERVISVLRLQRAAEFYRVPVDRVLPRQGRPKGIRSTTERVRARPAEGSMPQRPLTLDLARLHATESIEGQVIRRYITSIQNQRATAHGAVMAIRVEDLTGDRPLSGAGRDGHGR